VKWCSGDVATLHPIGNGIDSHGAQNRDFSKLLQYLANGSSVAAIESSVTSQSSYTFMWRVKKIGIKILCGWKLHDNSYAVRIIS
jgi:hypothetical protein